MVWTSSITMPSVVGIVGRAPAVDKKVWCFLYVCVSCCGFTKFVIMETLWSSVIFKTIMVSLHRRRFVAVHVFNFFSQPPEFCLRGKFIPKITIFRDFVGCKPTFLKLQWWNLGADLGLLPQAKFLKAHKGKFISKNTNFGTFGSCRPIFFKPQR